MLIQAAADFHGRESRYRAFLAGLKDNNPDVTVLAGDIDSNPSFFEFLKEVKIPVLIVHGNMDSVDLGQETEEFGNAIFLHKKVYSLEGINFVGAGGGNPMIEDVYSIVDDEWMPLSNAEVDVLVTHVPPKGVMDRMALGFHIGSKWVKEIVEEKKPRLVLCGHVHEDPGYAVSGETVVVNCSIGRKGEYTLIKMDDRNSAITVDMV